MTVNLDNVTTEMLRVLMKRKNKNDPKKYLSELIQQMYLQS